MQMNLDELKQFLKKFSVNGEELFKIRHLVQVNLDALKSAAGPQWTGRTSPPVPAHSAAPGTVASAPAPDGTTGPSPTLQPLATTREEVAAKAGSGPPAEHASAHGGGLGKTSAEISLDALRVALGGPAVARPPA